MKLKQLNLEKESGKDNEGKIGADFILSIFFQNKAA
jgi:hypothetical protein